jgi:hypothetical protein
MMLQEKNRCVVTQRFYTAYRTQWGPQRSWGAGLRQTKINLGLAKSLGRSAF